MRAVIIEDNELVRSVLTKFLERRGWKVRSFENPAEFSCPAIKGEVCTLEQACCDVIITDKNMPAMAGLSFLRSLARCKCRCTSIAMISGDWAEETMSEVKAMGFSVFEKPVPLAAVLEWLNKVTCDPPPA